MKKVAIIQARMGSTRLAGKILSKLEDKLMLEHIHTRLTKCKNLDDIIIATTTESNDDVVEKLAQKNNYKYFRGSSADVLNRYYETAKHYNADIIVRITADCPLICPKLVDKDIELYINGDYDLVSPRSSDGLIRGLDNEVLSFKLLEKLNNSVTDISEREHVTLHILHNPNTYKILSPEIDDYYKRNYRLTVDEKDDFRLIEEIYKRLYKTGEIIDIKDVVQLLDSNSDLAKMNAHVEQKKT